MSVPPIGNPDYIKYTNINRVFQCILANQPITRTDIATLVDISKVTVTNCVEYLLSKKIICETGVTLARRGRPRVQLVCNKDFGILAAFDIDVIQSRMLVTDFAGNILESKAVSLPLSSPEDTVRSAIAEIERIQKTYPELPVLGLGVSISGFYDFEKEKVITANYGPDWKGFDIKEEFARYQPDLPVFVERLANSGALGEASFGIHTGAKVHAYLHCSYGVGAGIYRKTSRASDLFCVSSRFGHTTIDYKGRRCRCGNRGCLEAYASLSSLLTIVHPDAPLNYDSLITLQTEYAEQNADVEKEIHNLFHYLAIGITNLFNAYLPDVIYLGGLVDLFLTEDAMNSIMQEVAIMIPESYRRNLKIMPCTLKENAVCYGGIANVRNHIIGLIM